MTHSLTLGTLLLTDSLPDAEYGYTLDVLADGVGFGVAQGVQEVVRSLLADGDLVRITRYGNREVSFMVHISGPTLASLAEGEAALRREVGRSNLLTWQPPDTMSAPTVFEVITSEMAQKFDDLEELRKHRTFVVTLACSPGARSMDATVIAALTPPPTTPVTASITTADTITGFSAAGTATTSSGQFSGPVTVVDGGAYAQAQITGGRPELVLTYSASTPIATSATPYVVMEISGDYPTAFYINGIPTGVVLARATPSGTTMYVLNTGGATLVSVAMSREIPYAIRETTLTLSIHDIYRTNTIPQITGRQTSAIVEIGGTERTPCSLQVTPAAGESMGLAIVHTSPESGTGYSPALRQRRTSGNAVTTSSGLVSGAREPVAATPIVAQIPLTSLPEDGYSLVALMRSSVVGTFPVSWQCRTFFAGNYLGGYSGTAQASFGAANTWTLIPLAVVTLPPVRASQQASVQLDLNRTAVASEVIDLDEWWAFRTGEDCGLSIVSSAASFLWLDSPDVSSPVPRVWVGNNGDRSDARHPGASLIAQGNHVLHPEGTSLFVASSGIQNPTVVATAFRRWHSNAAS